MPEDQYEACIDELFADWFTDTRTQIVMRLLTPADADVKALLRSAFEAGCVAGFTLGSGDE